MDKDPEEKKSILQIAEVRMFLYVMIMATVLLGVAFVISKLEY